MSSSDSSQSPTPQDWEAMDSSATPDSDDKSATSDDEIRCKYPSKFCGRPRVRKSTGSFHRYCQYHRDKASANQKRWTSVRREQAALEDEQLRLQERRTLGSPSFPGYAERMQMDYSLSILLPDPIELGHCPEPADLSAEETLILSAILIGEPTAMTDADEYYAHESICQPTRS